MTDHPTRQRITGLLDALVRAAPEIRIDGDQAGGPLSARGLFASALRALDQRQKGAAALALSRLSGFLRLGIAGAVAGTPAAASGLEEIEDATDRILIDCEARFATGGPALDAEALQALCHWEADDLMRPLSDGEIGSGEHADVVDATRLTLYLRRYLEDSSVIVTACRQLTGGFGKETHLFSVESRSLSGDFVMRRDMPVPLIPNACHRVDAEFAVLKAVRNAGFVTPDVLWVDTDHPELAGGDFIVMRRSRGQAGGSLFGADKAPDPSLNDRLGEVMAALHSLPALRELGDLTESIRSDLWDVPAHDAVRAYLDNYLGMFRNAPHTPSPATAAIFQWLLENVPQGDLRATLVHGDIGFHNMLLDEGELVAVLDWEFAHIGHPAEDLAYAFNAAGHDLDWQRVIRAYEAAGGPAIPRRDFEYFRILMQARNAVSTNLASAKLFGQEVSDLRLLSGDFYFRPHILKSLGALIAAYDAEFG